MRHLQLTGCACTTDPTDLTTFFLSLLCHWRSLSSGSVKRPAFLAEISRLPNFLNGVSSHLDHLDPTIRRLGMLVAEIVSSFTSQLTPQNVNKSKVLDFGKSMWDGIGQGKEECRVLRAFVDGWKLHDPSTAKTIWTQEEVREVLGILSEQIVKGHEAEADLEVISSAEFQSINEDKSNSEPRPRPQAQTRSLPAKVAPPTRIPSASTGLPSLFPVTSSIKPRPLIESLSESEDEEKSDSSASLRAYDDRSSDTSGSSSYEDTSDSGSDGGGIADQIGSALGLDAEGLRRARAATSENKENDAGAVDPGVPKKKKKIAPVYVAELSPLLKANTREDNRMGLRHAATLIKKKAGWGGEVGELRNIRRPLARPTLTLSA